MNESPKIYFDHNATTPCDGRVVEAMLPFFTTICGNAASQHWAGREADEAVGTARQQLATLLGVSPREIIWTSGATEANNIAVKGIASASHRRGGGRHVITQATEHKAILDPLRRLQSEGFELTVLPVDEDGRLDPETLRKAMRPDTALVSVMWANNETGTVQDIAGLVHVAKSVNPQVLFHSDATQAVGRIPVLPERAGVDLLSCSAHKVYGPKGCGALYVHRGQKRLVPEPLFDGGGHERGLRPGTLNVPGIVGFGAACRIAGDEQAQAAVRLRILHNDLLARLRAGLSDVLVNGSESQGLPNTLNVCLVGASAESVMLACPEIAMSAGSACTSTKIEPSHVLRAMGFDEERCFSSLRLSLGRGTTAEEVSYVADRLCNVVRAVRSISTAC